MQKTMWMVRAEGGALYDLLRDKSIVAIGWGAIGPLTDYVSRDAMKKAVAARWPEWSDGKVANSAGQLFRLKNEIRIGDGVITYSPQKRIYSVGEVVGEYEFAPELCKDDPNVRRVKWIGEIRRDQLTVDSRNVLGGTLTLWKLPDETRVEVEALTSGAVPPMVEEASVEVADEKNLLDDIQARASEFIKDRITKLAWDDVQELVVGLLRAMNYKTQISLPGADRGKDIVASPDGFGFESPRIVVEVKHRVQAIWSPDIRSFLGGRHAQDRGLYVSRGGFTKDAYYEADRANIPLQLMDLDLLVQSVLSYYDKFDMETQRLLPLKRVYWPE